MPQRRISSILVAVFLPAALLLLAVDYAASYLAPRDSPPQKVPQLEYLEFDPLQMWRLRRGFSYGDIRISEDGFRSDVPVARYAGKKLVFVIGASTVFGVGVKPNQTITYFLQKLADQYRKNEDLVFINAGVTGYYSTQELIHLERNVLPHRPSIVISLSGRNDAFYGLHPNYAPDAIPYHGLLRKELGALDPYYRSEEAPRIRLHAVRWLADALGTKPFNWLQDFEAPRLSPHPAAVEVFLRNQQSAHALLQGLGVQHFFFLQPTIDFPSRVLAAEEAGKDQAYYHAALKQAYMALATAAEQSLPKDWFRGMADISGQPGQLFLDNTHFSENGARLAAQRIYEAIWGGAL